MSHASRNLAQFASRLLRNLPLMLLMFSLVALNPRPAKATDADTASVAVDIFVEAGSKAGLPINKQEAEIVKQIVTCGVAGTPAGDCVRNTVVAMVLKQVGAIPAEAQPLVSCMVSGQGNIADCTKKFAEGLIINKVPSDFQPAATCIIESGDAKKCATNFVVQQITKQLNLSPADKDTADKIVGCLGSSQPAAGCVVGALVPKEIAPLVECVKNGGNVGSCAVTFASNQLPPGVAKDMIGCMDQPNFAKCAADKGVSNAQDAVASQISPAARKAIQDALNTIDRLRPDAPITIDAGVSSDNVATLQNILKVARGIKDGDWSEVVLGAGPELAIVASNIILSVFLTPALASALGPAVDAMIHNDAAAAQLALQAVSKGDAIGLAQVAFTWYETQFIDKPCALLGDNDVKNTICGGLSDAIKFISDSGGDLAKKLLDVGKDVLQWLGVWGTVDDVATFTWNTLKGAVETLGHFFGIGSDDDEWKPAADCGSLSPASYFADNYLSCVTKATDTAAGNNGKVDTSQLDQACVAKFNSCTAPKNRAAVTKACGAMAASLDNLAKQVSDGMQTAADVYTKFGGPAKYVNDASKFAESEQYGPASRDFCDPNFWDAATKQHYAGECSSFVRKQFPLPKPASMGGPACAALPTYNSGATKACLDKLNASLDASAAKGLTLTGPNSDYCKKQKDWIALHPCETVVVGKPILIPGGGQIDDIKIVCKDNSPLITPPWTGAGSPLGPSASAPWVSSPAPPLGTPTSRLPFPNNSSSGTNWLGGLDANTSIKAPTSRITPLLGSSSGSNMINGGTGNAPTTRPQRPKKTAVPGSPLKPKQAAPGNSSGFNTSTSPGNPAMDRLSGGGGGFGSVGGNSGGVALGGRASTRSSGSSSGTNTSRSIPSGNSSGTNTSRSIPSGNSSGTNTSRSIPSGNSSGSNTSRQP